MKRSEFLNALVLGLGGLILEPYWPLLAQALPTLKPLILIELKGGNDGLNTLIPFGQNEYYQLRPQLGVPREKILHLNHEVGLHPSLKPLLTLWKNKDLALIQGVGYKDPNRSHFRSIEIWDTAAKSHQYLHKGWLAQALEKHPTTPYLSHGVVLGQMSPGPMLGGHALMLKNPGQFLRQAKHLKQAPKVSRNEALQHIVSLQNEIHGAADALQHKLSRPHPFKVRFPRTPLGRELELVAQILAMGLTAPVFKLSHGSFDTHNRQANPHGRLLQDLAQALNAFELACKELNLWDQVLLMTYSEFGRRPKENGSQGTDHGTASVHLALGGKVKGGLYGRYPDLSHIDNEDLEHHVDFKQLYATVLKKHWHLPASDLGHSLDFIG